MKTKALVCGVVFIVVVVLISVAAAGEWVKFEGKTMMGDKLELEGVLSKPEGDGPFPAVVMLCGCGGFKNEVDAKQQNTWVERLMSWGYVALQVDSFGPRNYDNICDDTGKVNNDARSLDAYSAKSYLMKLDFVDSKNIAVIGWSHGGWAVMKIVDGRSRDKDAPPFQAAIAFYPWCDPIMRLDTPLLILIGEEDDWCPASKCEMQYNYWSGKGSKYEFKLKLYPNAYHAFDYEGLKEYYLGHHVEYNPEVAADAIIQTRDFLAKYLKTKNVTQ